MFFFRRWRPILYGLAVRVSVATSIIACAHGSLSVMEMQAIMTGLLERYEFSIPPNVQIEAGNPGLVVPSVKWKEMEGPQLPLKVTPRAAA